MEVQLKSHGFTKVLLCRKRCNYCGKAIRLFGLRCRFCRQKYHKHCSTLAPQQCYPCGKNGKSKTFLKRPLVSNHKENKANEYVLCPSTYVTRHDAREHHVNGINRLDSYRDNVITSPVKLRKYSPNTGTLVSVGDVYRSHDRLSQNSTITSPTHFYYSSMLTPSLNPKSAVSSGYSSVNHSCASSAGSGSQRSRSTTPEEFEASRDEFTIEENTSKFDEAEELLVCGGEIESPLTGSPLFHLESDEDLSGCWDQQERSDSLDTRSGLKKSLKELEIPYCDLQIHSKIGVGPNGPVYRGRWHGDVMIHTRRTSQPEEVEKFRKEVFLLSMIRHENVMLFMGACLDPPNLAVVVSLRKCLSIHHHLHCQDSRWSIAMRLNIMRQIAQGMSYLHAKSITVPFLRTMNIFLESKVKLCMNDYTSLHHQVKRKGYGSVPQGHLTYLAPEVISKVHIDVLSGRIVDSTVRTRKMDVHAFGTVMYEILTDKWPFSNLSPETVIWMIGKGLPQSLSKVKGPDCVKNLIKSCWSHDPSQRPEFVHIIQILNQKNISTNCISRRHSISEPKNMQYTGKITDYCQLKRI
ncbi:kinase suppressor of Ras 1-like [Xenia sp. Carnegie-2017]|uniref:kinase suppressor of Ras 1-like n=1 Tax=Xenia sp. Carnegie-2017 TaxID=2897299 RepID=UPI001F035578|nr:kinase suppressor of Ras 1-like [Xenia sp. Carnegie-2017]XP_046864894.1 kinase suppressor of Ras 1-like [Xenia sp. Carnegie-2017]